MAKPDEIETKQFGLAKVFLTPDRSGRRGMWRITFDTGIILYVPNALFDNMAFHLPESDRPPSKR